MEDWREWLEEEKEKALDEKWDFNKFKIECCKCNSKDVEINGEGEAESGWYGSASHTGSILIKCHECGHAMRIDLCSWWELKGALLPSKVNQEKVE
jgi:hypothetical protein